MIIVSISKIIKPNKNNTPLTIKTDDTISLSLLFSFLKTATSFVAEILKPKSINIEKKVVIVCAKTILPYKSVPKTDIR